MMWTPGTQAKVFLAALSSILAGGILASISQWLGPLWLALPLFLVLALSLAVVLGFVWGRPAARALESMEGAARRWGSGRLEHRARPSGPAELRRLGEALNSCASDLQLLEENRRRRAEERFIQADKLATIGQLAAGVAHELNNPLGGILLCADLITEAGGRGNGTEEQVRQIRIQASRAKTIVRGLLDFARQEPPQMERIDLNTVLSDVIGLLERQPLYQKAQVRLELSRVPLWIQADAGKLQQVFINIILNALEAMREGGVLTLRTGFSEREGFCRAAVSDTGFGMTEEQISRIFEPFYTTKEVGRGVGLGLAISHGIVRQHGGEIEVQSQIGSGSTFRVLLPAEREA